MTGLEFLAAFGLLQICKGMERQWKDRKDKKEKKKRDSVL